MRKGFERRTPARFPCGVSERRKHAAKAWCNDAGQDFTRIKTGTMRKGFERRTPARISCA